MLSTPSSLGRAAAVIVVAAIAACLATTTVAGAVTVRRVYMPSFKAPGTPEPFISPKRSHLPKEIDLNRVGAIEVGPKTAHNVLVLEPGTSAVAAYFVPLAKSLVEHTKGWQVWAVERRENLLEDQSKLTAGKKLKLGAQAVFC